MSLPLPQRRAFVLRESGRRISEMVVRKLCGQSIGVVQQHRRFTASCSQIQKDATREVTVWSSHNLERSARLRTAPAFSARGESEARLETASHGDALQRDRSIQICFVRRVLSWGLALYSEGNGLSALDYILYHTREDFGLWHGCSHPCVGHHGDEVCVREPATDIAIGENTSAVWTESDGIG